MTTEEYIQLVQAMEVFATFEAEIQQIILQAQGDQMQRYLDILTQAQNLMDRNREQFFERCTKAMEDFKLNLKKIKTDKRVGDETQSTHEDEKVEEQLLEQLSQL